MAELLPVLAPVIMMLCMGYFILYVRKNKKKTNTEHQHQSQQLSPKVLSDLNKVENDILLKLTKYEKEICAKLDDRIVLLNELIHEADNRIKELNLSSKSSPIENGIANRGLPKQASKDQIVSQVKMLKEKGLATKEIAQQLAMMEGEVKLILGLSN